MAVNNLLVAYDGSDGAKRALSMAADMARANNQAHIDIVHVVPIPLLDDARMTNFQEILDMMVSDAEDLLVDAAHSVGNGLADRVSSLLLTGTNPANEILRLIDQRDYDVVLVGNRGLSGIQAYLGSVSHKILYGSKTSVLVVKE